MNQRISVMLRFTLLLLLGMAVPLLLNPVCAKASTHLWPLSALHFEEPAPETATFKMTEQEFTTEIATRKLLLDDAYQDLWTNLSQQEQLALADAQAGWQNCCDKYAAALKAQLDQPVKVFYGVEGEERKTNIYKDTLLALLAQRTADLQCWALGRYAYGGPENLAEAQNRLATQTHLIEQAFVRNTYVMEERYRTAMWEAQQAWHDFMQLNQNFVACATQNNEAIIASEELLQVQRMYALTLLHKEGSVFFHREREE